jgi:hypothetical protein
MAGSILCLEVGEHVGRRDMKRPKHSALALLVGALSLLLVLAYSLPGTMALLSDRAVGETDFAAGEWDSGPSAGCTYSSGYWQDHPQAWPVTSIEIGEDVYSQAAAMVILSFADSDDATYLLSRQLIAAKLNVLSGADSQSVAQTLADADRWLVAHPLGSDPLGPDRATGLSLADDLMAYNVGETGPGACTAEGEGIPTSTP